MRTEQSHCADAESMLAPCESAMQCVPYQFDVPTSTICQNLCEPPSPYNRTNFLGPPSDSGPGGNWTTITFGRGIRETMRAKEWIMEYGSVGTAFYIGPEFYKYR